MTVISLEIYKKYVYVFTTQWQLKINVNEQCLIALRRTNF